MAWLLFAIAFSMPNRTHTLVSVLHSLYCLNQCYKLQCHSKYTTRQSHRSLHFLSRCCRCRLVWVCFVSNSIWMIMVNCASLSLFIDSMQLCQCCLRWLVTTITVPLETIQFFYFPANTNVLSWCFELAESLYACVFITLSIDSACYVSSSPVTSFVVKKVHSLAHTFGLIKTNYLYKIYIECETQYLNIIEFLQFMELMCDKPWSKHKTILICICFQFVVPLFNFTGILLDTDIYSKSSTYRCIQKKN